MFVYQSTFSMLELKQAKVLNQNNYETKIVNAFIINDLNNWAIIPFRNFTLKNCLFGVTNMAKKSDKS